MTTLAKGQGYRYPMPTLAKGPTLRKGGTLRMGMPTTYRYATVWLATCLEGWLPVPGRLPVACVTELQEDRRRRDCLM